MSRRVCAWCAVLLIGWSPAASAQATSDVVRVRGDVSVAGLVMPGREATEGRMRGRVELTADPAPWLKLTMEGVVDGLLADRRGRVEDGAVRAREAWAEVRHNRLDLRVGYGRLVWGRLDEIMPSDVLTPIDSSWYFLEGRAEARLPVAFARGRVFVAGDATVELVVSLPGRRGRFDQLAEPSSPFNLVNDVVLPAAGGARVRREEPATRWSNLQTGGRVSSTAGRVDFSVSAYRGFEGFGHITFEAEVPAVPAPGVLVVGELVERYPRFTMLAADAETVVGAWAIRAESALFVRRELMTGAGAVSGRVWESGVGLDRAVGDTRWFGSLVWRREWLTTGTGSVNHDLSLIASVERRLARERYLVRVFGVLNPVDDSGFVRSLLGWTLRDDVTLEVSGGLLWGDDNGTDTLSRFRERDFVFTRVRWSF